jgi:NAD(P)-dependent dehydrogenase (short-subunit alcohol dehydrogenase family)
VSARHVAVVTGAGQGIGAAIAERLAAAGAFVFATGRRLDPCEQLVQRLRKLGHGAEALELDVTRRESLRGAIERISSRSDGNGRPDWLVNNAGIARSAPLPRPGEPDGVYDEHLAVNFHGARRMVEALLPGMRERGFGRIVNVASSAGLRGYAYVSAYCASKHALVGYTRAAALELEGSGVAIAAVCPHYVDSPLVQRSAERIAEKTGRTIAEARALLAAQNPGGRLLAPEEVAEAVLELLQEGRNGAIVELDGSGGGPATASMAPR